MEAQPNKAWWKKQRTWALVLGVIGTVAGVIPAISVASVPILTVAGLLGYKGLADSQTRVENTTAKTEQIAESNAEKLDTATR